MSLGTISAFARHSHVRVSGVLESVRLTGGQSSTAEMLFLGVLLDTLQHSGKLTTTASTVYAVLDDCASLLQVYCYGALAMLDPQSSHDRLIRERVEHLMREIEECQQTRHLLVKHAVEQGFLSKAKSGIYSVVRVP
ncbi:MAG TPA: hypothetical protein VNG90_01485 [Candidatus Acidoferrum sp.]|nr:hypothetical protein [Candidatus Acidoferrum sp.]